ncbi:MAG: hypothetical protein M1391_18670 [Bacteroidetes bacterium]|nr:hypothetical protein [Bacteroidota bacterium]
MNKTKYLSLILIALFFASTNELSAKEAEQNYNIENHSFIETANYSLISSIDKLKDNYKKHFPAYPFVISHSFYCNNYFDSLNTSQLKFLPQFFRKNLYIYISILRI